jgi:DNA-binding transcriptional regulator YhcF (GntR family)
VYGKQLSVELNEDQKAYQIMQESGFIGSIEGGGNLSETYKDHLDWYHKL